MIRINNHLSIDEREIEFTYSTSPGPGGQNVNKVATRATLRFNVVETPSLSDFARHRLLTALGSRLDRDGSLRIVASRFRSQSANREDAIERFVDLLSAALRPVKKRKATRPSAGSRERRLEAKRRQGARKADRRRHFGRED